MLTVTGTGVARAGDLGAQLLGHVLRRVGVGVGQQHEELLPAEAPELVLRAQVRAHRVRGRDQHRVAGLVAVACR